MDPTWNFLRLTPMMVPADHMANPLAHTKLTDAELLMREAIQNSADEHRADAEDPVRFTTRRKVYRGEEKQALVEAFKLHEIFDRSHVFPSETGWLRTKETCLAHLNDPDFAIPVLLLSDHNTNGLGGAWDRRGLENRFHNLVLSIYSSHKAEDADLLGSYGVGKMVYAVASRIRTMAYYSTFKPTETSDGVSARFMSSAFLPTHDLEDQPYSGHAFFGEPSESDRYSTRPLNDAAAHSFAKSVGMEVRSEKDTGLTVMLLDCDIEPKECLSACERYWWPRNLGSDPSSFLEFEFFDGDEKLEAFDPARKRELKPFIDCYSNAMQGVQPEGYELAPINLKGGVHAGDLSLKPMVDGDLESTSLVNTVALIRSGLVIQYCEDYAREGDPNAVGIFVAGGSEAKRAFMLSEPEAHDEWNSNTGRLKRAIGEDAAQLVRRSHKRIKDLFRDFQMRLKDRPREKTSDSLDFLDDLLGPLFKKPRKGPPQPPESRERAFRVTKTGWRDVQNDPAQDCLEFSITLRDDLGVDGANCDISAVLRVLETADAGLGSSIPCEILDSDGNVMTESGNRFEVEFASGESMTFRASAPVHPTWRTRWIVSVTGKSSD